MSKKPKAILSPREFDAMCKAFKEAERVRDSLWKQLYRAARSQGACVPGAPKSRLLAGAAFEALASLGTRTDVDQKKAGVAWDNYPEGQAFHRRHIFEIAENWERTWLFAAGQTPKQRDRLRRRVLACLRFRPVKRLSVRKRKSAASAKSVDRRAAA